MRGDVVGDGEQFERGERAEDHVDLVALDQFLRLGLGAGGIAAGIGGDQFDRPSGDLIAAVLQEQRDALLHLDAALRERSGLHRQQPDADRLVLRDGGHRQRRRQGGAGEKCAPV